MNILYKTFNIQTENPVKLVQCDEWNFYKKKKQNEIGNERQSTILKYIKKKKTLFKLIQHTQ